MAPLLSFDELNKYEEVRQPHRVSEEISVVIHPDSVRSEFTCIICLDILTKTMTSKHCVHRFCYDCITTSLRLGNKECPTCRAKLSSKRDLRADLVFDSLIATLFSKDIQSPADRQSSKLTDSILSLNLTTVPNQSNEKNEKSYLVRPETNDEQRKLSKQKKNNVTETNEVQEPPKITKQKNCNRKNEKTTETEKEPNPTNKKGHEALNSNDEDYNKKSNKTKNPQNNKETRKIPLRKSLRHKDAHIKHESKESKQNDHKRVKNKNRNTKRKDKNETD